MRIGIDISQIVYEGTGVARYTQEMIAALLTIDKTNEYVLFGASLRKQHFFYEYFEKVKKVNKSVELVVAPIPPTLLDIIWNFLHILPVEWFIGPVDVFWSSDWTQPPLSRCAAVTTIHDLIALKYPSETDERIVGTHKRRLSRVVRECHAILCDSQSTKKDVKEMLKIPVSRLYVVYPGYLTNL